MSDVYRQIIEQLSRCRRVLVTTHVRPDGDAIGTTAALILAMRKAGIEAEFMRERGNKLRRVAAAKSLPRPFDLGPIRQRSA